MPANDSAAFISYSRDDSEFALRLAEDLKAAGASVWLDQLDIEPGQEWDSAIESALFQSPRMLLILSPSSAKSSSVRNEISFALDEKKIIIPVFYQDCTVPLQLRRVQYVDFRTDRLRGLKALLKSLGVQPSQPSVPMPAEVSQEPFSVSSLDEPQERSTTGPEVERGATNARQAARKTAASQASKIAEPKDRGQVKPQSDGSQRATFQGLVKLLPQSSTWASAAVLLGLVTLGVLYFVFFKRSQMVKIEDLRQKGAVGAGDASKQPLQTEPPALQPTALQSGWAVVDCCGHERPSPEGTHGVILHTKDGGSSWQKQASSTDADLNSISFVTPQSGWAVGHQGTILHTEDGGGTWRKQAGGTDADFNSISFVTSRSGWIVGRKGTILHTDRLTDGRWKKQISGTDAWLRSVFFVTPQLGWAVGNQDVTLNPQGVILHTKDGGSTWQKQAGGSGAHLRFVYFVTSQSGWAVGDEGTILHTEDSGDTWKKQTSGTDAWLLSVSFVTPQSGWIAGGKGTILHTEDGGGTWKKQISGTDAWLRSLVFVTPQLGWVVGDEGTILHTEDGGGTWKKQTSGADESIYSVAFVNPR